MKKIDAHNHFWIYDKDRDSWITEDMYVIKKDFLPNDLYALFKENNVDGTVAIQADQSEKETAFLLELAKENDFIKGIVGWIDLKNKNVDERLNYYSNEKKVKGFRHILQAENVSAYLNDQNFLHGISLLKKYNFTYDILVNHHQLKYINNFVKCFPNQRFVIDHLAKPDIKNHLKEDWKKEISIIAQNENIFCKLSGMVTEADWNNWKTQDLFPFIDIVVENFGTDRIMFGSDWPVGLLAASYKQWLNIIEDYFKDFSSSEQEKIFGENAIRFYNL